MPTQERNPIAVREVCSSRSQKPNVFPTKRKGRPEENPSNNIASVLGRRYSAIRCLCGLTRSLSIGASRNSNLLCLRPLNRHLHQAADTLRLKTTCGGLYAAG